MSSKERRILESFRILYSLNIKGNEPSIVTIIWYLINRGSIYGWRRIQHSRKSATEITVFGKIYLQEKQDNIYIFGFWNRSNLLHLQAITGRFCSKKRVCILTALPNMPNCHHPIVESTNQVSALQDPLTTAPKFGFRCQMVA